jgi:hypothetical protein
MEFQRNNGLRSLRAVVQVTINLFLLKAAFFLTNDVLCLTFIALKFTQVPVPMPGTAEVLVNIKYSGVCHSDLQAWKGGWPLDPKKDLIGKKHLISVPLISVFQISTVKRSC